MDFFYYDTEDHVERFIAMLEGVSATIQVLILSHACINVEVPSTSLDLMPAVFPCLRFLVVESWLEIGDTDSEQSVIASLCRAACAVDRLHIIGRYCARVHSFLHAGALQFPAVRFLRYCIVDEGPSADWLTFIAAFPLLEELQISGGNPAPVLHAAMAMDAAAAAGEGVPAWRNLKTLIFLGAHEYIAVRFVQHRARTGHPLAAVTYAGWFGAHAKQVFKTLNVNYTPLRRSMADGHDSTKDWIEYWRMVNGELEFLSLPVSSDSSVPIEIC
ncbi:hypothetical protein PsYK624_144240 [Phanerochaete sordida]|uniref:Uncharacterized protein n=1 Tax=Phanerochaete sordida TaxID=48140 RepID=A0A9P3LK65_9APHY|nr:hypothetical protein PsYK624_144240 [Phanerochaete sordida]